MENKKRMLFIEDDYNYQNSFMSFFNKNKVDITLVWNKEGAYKLFDEEIFDIIVVDACLESRNPDTMELVTYMRSKFNGPILANSSTSEYADVLMQAGCTHKIPNKGHAALFVEALIKELS